MDHEHPDIGWRVPDDAWIKRHEAAIRRAVDELRGATAPAPETFIREGLATLAAYKGSRAGVPSEWKIRGREYVRLLGHVPADIWQDALDRWALTSKWFPDISELLPLMQPELADRYRRLERLEAMLKPKVEHRPKAADVWRASERQLRAALGEDAWRVWLSQVIPKSDDGETLVLAAPSSFIARAVKETYGEAIEDVVNRRVQVCWESWVSAALRERELKRA